MSRAPPRIAGVLGGVGNTVLEGCACSLYAAGFGSFARHTAGALHGHGPLGPTIAGPALPGTAEHAERRPLDSVGHPQNFVIALHAAAL